ncbi:YnfC family lipoprotein, partial [Klebsiella pneumoniae]|uniref:YnfC family lipoprotein n=1 Tax=Klebsiella pneumoniae TaxID=573 RepID=UPI0028F44856
TGATLLLDANYYVDGRTHEKRLRLQGKCQLAEMPAAGVSWETVSRRRAFFLCASRAVRDARSK